jgi:hypothetical protein
MPPTLSELASISSSLQSLTQSCNSYLNRFEKGDHGKSQLVGKAEVDLADRGSSPVANA